MSRRIAADPGLEVEMGLHCVDHLARHEARAGIVQIGLAGGGGYIGADAVEVEGHGGSRRDQ
jgi:hypothetical protein